MPTLVIEYELSRETPNPVSPREQAVGKLSPLPTLRPEAGGLILAVYERLKPLGSQILPPHSADITSSDTSQLDAALADANAVVSLTGILVGSEKKMIAVQEEGARRVAEAAKKGGVDRVVGISAIGADRGGVTP